MNIVFKSKIYYQCSLSLQLVIYLAIAAATVFWRIIILFSAEAFSSPASIALKS